MIIFHIIFTTIMFLGICTCQNSEGSLAGFCIWAIITSLVVIIYKKAKKLNPHQKFVHRHRARNSVIYFNNYGELP